MTTVETSGYVLMKRGAYWRPNSQGYTNNLAEAGIYTDEESAARCENPDVTRERYADALARVGALSASGEGVPSYDKVTVCGEDFVPARAWLSVPDYYIVAVNEFLWDWQKGDFSLSTLAALDAQNVIEAVERWEAESRIRSALAPTPSPANSWNEAIEADKAPELVKALADRTIYAQTLEKLRSTLHNVTDAIEDEGDRRYFGSTNDADELAAIAEQIEGLLWDDIIEQAHPRLDLYAEMRKLNAEIRELKARALAAEARNADLVKALERATEAVTPSGDTKAAYLGEFYVRLPDIDEAGNEFVRDVNVPWTTIKEIMAAIRARQLTKDTQNEQG